jgi:hypothetical protein
VFRGGGRKICLVPMSWQVEAPNPLAGASGPCAITGDDCKIPPARFGSPKGWIKRKLGICWENVGVRVAG